jgi:hypothetical protein
MDETNRGSSPGEISPSAASSNQPKRVEATSCTLVAAGWSAPLPPPDALEHYDVILAGVHPVIPVALVGLPIATIIKSIRDAQRRTDAERGESANRQ